MATYILNKHQVVNFKLDSSRYNVLVRITSPEDEFLPLDDEGIYRDILYLQFYDLIDDSIGIKIFDDIELDRIVNFFKKHKYCDNMVIHCDQGRSRSAGIAVGWFLFNDNNSSIYTLYHDKKHIPNRRVVEAFFIKFKKNMKYLNKWEDEKLL